MGDWQRERQWNKAESSEETSGAGEMAQWVFAGQAWNPEFRLPKSHKSQMQQCTPVIPVLPPQDGRGNNSLEHKNKREPPKNKMEHKKATLESCSLMSRYVL